MLEVKNTNNMFKKLQHWINKIKHLPDVGKAFPHEVYTAFVFGYQKIVSFEDKTHGAFNIKVIKLLENVREMHKQGTLLESKIDVF